MKSTLERYLQLGTIFCWCYPQTGGYKFLDPWGTGIRDMLDLWSSGIWFATCQLIWVTSLPVGNDNVGNFLANLRLDLANLMTQMTCGFECSFAMISLKQCDPILSDTIWDNFVWRHWRRQFSCRTKWPDWQIQFTDMDNFIWTDQHFSALCDVAQFQRRGAFFFIQKTQLAVGTENWFETGLLFLQ